MKGKVRAIPVLPARDLERARRFYEDKLGFSVEQKGPDGLLLRIGDSLVYLYETSASSGDATILTLDVEDFRSEFDALRESGVRFEEYDLPNLKTKDGVADMDGMKGAWFKDSEGNVLNISEWKEAERLAHKAA